MLKMKNISINKNNLILIVVIVLSLIFAYRVWQAQTEKIKSLKGVISQEEAKIGVLKNIELSNSKVNSFSKTLKKEDVKATIAKINNFASVTNVEIISIQPQKEETRENVYKVLPISLNIRGTYHNIGKFISLLEGPEQFFSIREFNLSSSVSPGAGEFGFEKKDTKKQLLSSLLVIESAYIE